MSLDTPNKKLRVDNYICYWKQIQIVKFGLKAGLLPHLGYSHATIALAVARLLKGREVWDLATQLRALTDMN